MSNGILKLSAAVAMVVAMPGLAGAQSIVYGTSSPVAITAFGVDESFASGVVGGEVENPPQFFPVGVMLRFVNQTNVPATNVTFVVSDGKYTQRIVDKGTFSPDTQIKHNFPVARGIGASPHATCKVVQVDFADGSSWHVVDANVAKR